MNYSDHDSDSTSLVWKIACGIAIVICLTLGIIGLVLPIIPGLLFLLIAAILLSKVSSRFDSLLSENETFTYWKHKWQSSDHLSLTERIKLSSLVAVKSLVDAIDSGIDSLRRSFR